MSIVLYREPGFTQAQNDVSFSVAVKERDRAFDRGDFAQAARQQDFVEKYWQESHPPELVYYDNDGQILGDPKVFPTARDLLDEEYTLTPPACYTLAYFLLATKGLPRERRKQLVAFLKNAAQANECVRMSY